MIKLRAFREIQYPTLPLWDTANSDPLQSALRRISPSHVPFHVSQVHLLEVGFDERPRDNGKTAWEISWNSVAVIPLNA